MQTFPSPDFALLHFNPDTATAADELLSRVDLVELVGQANINKRNALRTKVRNDMYLAPGHLDQMRPKVCQVLQEEE